MKTPGKVFILKNNEYIEITLQEHEVLKETMPGYLDKKFVFLHDCLMEVSEDFYVDFYTVKPPIDRTSYGITMGSPICRWLFCCSADTNNQERSRQRNLKGAFLCCSVGRPT